MLRYGRWQRVPRGGCLLFSLVLLLGLSGVGEAQYTHTFSNRMINMQMDNVTDVAVGSDGTLFLVNEAGGLWAYRHEDSEFCPKAFLPLAGEAKQVEVGPDGIVYVGNEWGDLVAYFYSGFDFKEIARAPRTTELSDFTVDAGGTIFVAAGHDGVQAYRRVGDAIIKTAQFINGSDFRTVAVSSDGVVYAASRYASVLTAYLFQDGVFTCIGQTTEGVIEAKDLTVRWDGTVFLSDMEGGLRSYRFDGGDLILTAHINEGGSARSVAAGPDDRIYLVNADDGLRVYDYTGTAFYLHGHWSCAKNDARNVAIAPDGAVLLANGADGLRVLACDNGPDIQCTAHFDIGDAANSVAVGAGGTIFLANGADGLRAYMRCEPFMRCTAATNGDADSDIYARAVTTDSKDRVFLAHDDGLSVYDYTGTSFSLIAHADAVGLPDGIAVDAYGRVYLACGLDGMQVFTFDGENLLAIRQVNDGGRAMDVAVGQDGNIYVANGDDGLRVYRWDGEELLCPVHLTDGGTFNWARKVAVGPDNTVFLASSQSGLHAYRFEGKFLVPTAQLSFDVAGYFGGVTSLTVGPDGTVFFGFSGYHTMKEDGLFACTYDGNGFTITAHADHSDFASDLAVAPNGVVYLADRQGGLLGYRYASAMGDPRISADRSSVDFGNVHLGSVGEQSVTISNTGNGPLHILDQKLITFGRYEFSLAFTLPPEIDPGESANLGLLFHPWGEGPKEAVLRILSDDPDRPITDIKIVASSIYQGEDPLPPHIVRLDQNNPNPFNPSTNIRYFVSQAGHARMTVFDLAGHRVATLVDGPVQAGWHTLRFDASTLPSGMYMYRIESGGQVQTKSMVLMK